MNVSVAKVVAGYLTASVAALVASVKLACILGGQMMVAFSGGFFR
ncbi:MAG: hypothetical protein ACYC7B_05955 [Burkholderiales bacterium]